MSLVKTTKFNEVPKDVELMTKAQALEHQINLIQDRTFGETWILRYGSGFLGLTSVASSFYVNNHFRRKLKLRNFNSFSSYLPTVVIPALITTLYHSNFILPDVLLFNDKCAVCTQTRAMGIQVGFGLLLPCILGPISSFMLATRYYTYRLPFVTENPRELLKIAGKMFKPIRGQILTFALLNAVFASYITYKEAVQFIDLNEKMVKEMEEEEEREMNSQSLVQK